MKAESNSNFDPPFLFVSSPPESPHQETASTFSSYLVPTIFSPDTSQIEPNTPYPPPTLSHFPYYQCDSPPPLPPFPPSHTPPPLPPPRSPTPTFTSPL